MICEKCNATMKRSINNSTQGWCCPICGWNIITTSIEDILVDEMEYSIYIKSAAIIDKDKIKFIAKTAKVNFIVAKQILEKNDVCILKAKAPEIKVTTEKLKELQIDYKVTPQFMY